LYIDWVNIPAQIKDAGGFTRSELKKVSDVGWKGTKTQGAVIDPEDGLFQVEELKEKLGQRKFVELLLRNSR
jgi:hypothetical protein